MLKLQVQLFGACDNQTMNIVYLVTGSAGFIGSELTLRLLERVPYSDVIYIDHYKNIFDKTI